LRGLLASELMLRLLQSVKMIRSDMPLYNACAPDVMFRCTDARTRWFQMLARLDPALMPLIIFVTGYEQYALQAFEFHAIDYLLKPFDAERFQRAFQHVRPMIERQLQSEVTARLAALLEELPKSQRYLSRLVVRSDGRMRLLPVEDVAWLEAQGNYVQVHTDGQTYSLREPLKSLEKALNPEQFLRIHRAFIVNIQRIQEQPWSSGEYTPLLRDGTRLLSSRSYHGSIECFA
jgi:two-component system LytT family response regulator